MENSITALLKQHEPWAVLRVGVQHGPIDFKGPGIVIIVEERSEEHLRPLEVLVAEEDAIEEATNALQQHAQRGKHFMAMLKSMPSKYERDQLLEEIVKHVMEGRAPNTSN